MKIYDIKKFNKEEIDEIFQELEKMKKIKHDNFYSIYEFW